MNEFFLKKKKKLWIEKKKIDPSSFFFLHGLKKKKKKNREFQVQPGECNKVSNKILTQLILESRNTMRFCFSSWRSYIDETHERFASITTHL